LVLGRSMYLAEPLSPIVFDNSNSKRHTQETHLSTFIIASILPTSMASRQCIASVAPA
jgi:hypothetical protein